MPMSERSASLAEVLDEMTAEGAAELTEHLPDHALRCYACGHRCLINEGKRGICKVRFNEGGHLRVPINYVAALACDPTEKKPFFHALPGSDTLTFGMLGCDLHCAYCFTPDTVIVTDRGPKTFDELFHSAPHVDTHPDAKIAHHENLHAVTASGILRQVRGIFKHPYRGQLAVVRPYYLPELRCTPDHRVYATDDTAIEPTLIQAGQLTNKHYLAIPRNYAFSSTQVVNVANELSGHQFLYRVPWELNADARQAIAEATTRGETSRQIGARLGKDASYIRHVRSKMARGLAQDFRLGETIIEGQTVRFPNEHRPGIPLSIPLNLDMARLLGLYCAEGSICSDKNRPNSHVLNFSFSHAETKLVDETIELVQKCLGVKAARVRRSTTLAVAVNKSSAALLFKSLAGKRSGEKRVPQILFDAHRPVVQAFLDAYVQGDGHRYENGKVSVTTISRQMAYGIAWLTLKLGHLPSVYDAVMPEHGLIQNRAVKRSPHQYTVVWYEKTGIARKVVETKDFYLVPLRDISFVEYEGDVYNMEVEEEHNYLAGFFLVSNCQNWLTSQALRDDSAGTTPNMVTADRLVSLAKSYGAALVGTSYNEPLITAEWAVEVFKRAKPAGFKTAFISNGNATPQVLDYIRPWTDCYKIDLKSMSDRNYRQLGGVVDNILETVKMVHERGFWEEIVTLVIPGFNDSEDELRRAADFIASVSVDIPWHVTAFHQDYHMTENANTTAEQLIRACEIGREAGLRYIYAGNLPGRVGRWENTYCPTCDELLVERYGYIIRQMKVTPAGKCPQCATTIPGVWA
ncbi:MAG: pyruvate formate lyase activating enzyme [Acidobacteriota bacterium]|jgi:pyruvate formate lyase activating enzyme|nr:pyruvate formate lyase activating enzyme [Acidobacteriota bacterium]